MTLSFFATAPKGLEQLLAAELTALGAAEVRPGRAGVSFAGPLEIAYRACLWSRLASRILLPLHRFPAPTPEALYEGIRAFPWEEHLGPDDSLAVDAAVADSRITHSQYAALRVKDGVVDRFREASGRRPSVDRERPSVRINLYLYRNQARLSLDLSGESLHRRGYRTEGTLAPLKENLAAAILLLSGWREIAAAGGTFLDPMCGSGTLPIEAALIAGDVAPGLTRPWFGFFGWRQHEPEVWSRLIGEAKERRAQGEGKIPAVIGWDEAPGAVRAALANVEQAGLRGRVHIERRQWSGASAPPGRRAGLVAVNPPYGERLGEEQELVGLFAGLGKVLRESFGGWRGAVFTGNPRLGARLGLRPEREDALYNGAIECRLLQFDIAAGAPEERRDLSLAAGEGAVMFANRLRKNLKNLGSWARRQGICCYRLYDADLPEYAVAVDLYQGEEGRWAHVQEYQAPASIDPAKAEARLREALAVIPEVLELAPDQVFFKVRRRQKGSAQYEKLAATGRFHEVREGGCRLLVNFSDYLDTGLFLDHRSTRELLRDLADGKRFLNLFCYTGSGSVQAAAGGAAATTSVDLSRTYLDWARRNLELNGFTGPAHRLIQADCLAWLEEEVRRGRERYDLIFLDPPTFSTSKRMGEATFDVQRDHAAVIRQAARLLAPGGTLVFSTNFRKFKMDLAALEDLQPQDLTRQTIPRDFERNPRIHQCWKLQVFQSLDAEAQRRRGKPKT